MTFKFDTLAIHAGRDADLASGARSVPISQTNSNVFKSVANTANLFGLKEQEYIYSRIMKPTVGVLEERLARPDLSDQGVNDLENTAPALYIGKGAAFLFTAGVRLLRDPGRTIGASQEQATAGGRE